MNRHLCTLLLAVLAFPNTIFSQQSSPEVNFQNWTKEDVQKILSRSPWSRTIEWRAQQVDTRQIGTVVLPLVPAKIMLRSALPIRQAMLRSRQIESKYDTMSLADKQAFDAKNKALIDCPACATYYVMI